MKTPYSVRLTRDALRAIDAACDPSGWLAGITPASPAARELHRVAGLPFDDMPKTVAGWGEAHGFPRSKFTDRWARIGAPPAGDVLDAAWRWRVARLVALPPNIMPLRHVADLTGWSHPQTLCRWIARVTGKSSLWWRPEADRAGTFLYAEGRQFLSWLTALEACTGDPLRRTGSRAEQGELLEVAA